MKELFPCSEIKQVDKAPGQIKLCERKHKIKTQALEQESMLKAQASYRATL